MLSKKVVFDIRYMNDWSLGTADLNYCYIAISV